MSSTTSSSADIPVDSEWLKRLLPETPPTTELEKIFMCFTCCGVQNVGDLRSLIESALWRKCPLEEYVKDICEEYLDSLPWEGEEERGVEDEEGEEGEEAKKGEGGEVVVLPGAVEEEGGEEDKGEVLRAATTVKGAASSVKKFKSTRFEGVDKLTAEEKSKEEREKELLKRKIEDEVNAEKWQIEEREGGNQVFGYYARIAASMAIGFGGALYGLMVARGAFFEFFVRNPMVVMAILVITSPVFLVYPWWVAFPHRISRKEFLLASYLSFLLAYVLLAVQLSMGFITIDASDPTYTLFVTIDCNLTLLLYCVIRFRPDWKQTAYKGGLFYFTLLTFWGGMGYFVIAALWVSVLHLGHIWRGIRPRRDFSYLCLFSNLCVLPVVCFFLLFPLANAVGSDIELAFVWQVVMIIAYMYVKVVSTRATTPWDSAALQFSIIIVADYFISFIFITAELGDPLFWGILAFDYALLVLRDSDSWDIVAKQISIQCGNLGHAAVVSAEILAGNVEDIGDRISGKIEMQMDRNIREAAVTERARIAVQISSLCVVSEVSSSVILLLMLLLEIHLGDDNLGNAALSKGMGEEQKHNALYVMLILVGVDLLALATSHAIIRRRHNAAIKAQVSQEMPTASKTQRRASFNIKMVEVETLHMRWKRELWKDHFWFLCASAYMMFALCTMFGAIFVQMAGGCRLYCGECLTKSACMGRGKGVCTWEPVEKEINPYMGVCSLCERGECGGCMSEQSCGVHDHCEWQSDGVSGGTCSDPLLAPDSMNFYDCVEYCNNDVEGGRIPCVGSQEEQDLLWARGGEETVWIGLFQTMAAMNGVEDWIDETCESSFRNWEASDPDNYKGTDERCTILFPNFGGKWNDSPCEAIEWAVPKCVCQPTSSPAVIDMDWLAGEV